MDLVKVLSEQQLKSDLPELKIGDTVKVHAKIKEGNRERIQVFEGIIIAMKHAGINKTVTVRRISYGVGVEKTFPVHSQISLSLRLFVTVRFAVLSCTTCVAVLVRLLRLQKRFKLQSLRGKRLNFVSLFSFFLIIIYIKAIIKCICKI